MWFLSSKQVSLHSVLPNLNPTPQQNLQCSYSCLTPEPIRIYGDNVFTLLKAEIPQCPHSYIHCSYISQTLFQHQIQGSRKIKRKLLFDVLSRSSRSGANRELITVLKYFFRISCIINVFPMLCPVRLHFKMSWQIIPRTVHVRHQHDRQNVWVYYSKYALTIRENRFKAW